MYLSIAQIIDAHGGMDNWKRHDTLSVDLSVGGLLWGLKGQSGILDHTTVTVGLKEEWASHYPFGPGNQRSHFRPAEVTIEDFAANSVERLAHPRASFRGHKMETAWSKPQLAYFAGYAMWTYLNLPFIALSPDVTVQSLPVWRENGEEWFPFRIIFPDYVDTHCKVQTLYAGSDGLLRRHDYAVDIAAGSAAAHYVERYISVDGIKFPTKRRVYAVDADNTPMRDVMTVSIDLSNFRFDDKAFVADRA